MIPWFNQIGSKFTLWRLITFYCYNYEEACLAWFKNNNGATLRDIVHANKTGMIFSHKVETDFLEQLLEPLRNKGYLILVQSQSNGCKGFIPPFYWLKSDPTTPKLNFRTIFYDAVPDAKASNVYCCDYCYGPVDRYEHIFRCRACLAIGDLRTGIMDKPYKIVKH
jgi:hypothetical protein